MPLEPERDLRWTAFLYIGGDLPAAEASAFEARLADDQAARDAVAAAVELAGALAIVGPEFQAGRRPILRRRAFVAAASLAAAACLALAIVPRLLPARSERASDPSDVAIAWSSLRGEPEVDWLTNPPEATTAEGESQVEVESEPSTDRALPSWLLTAASAPLGDEPRQED